jgi:hypothetical protein
VIGSRNVAERVCALVLFVTCTIACGSLWSDVRSLEGTAARRRTQLQTMAAMRASTVPAASGPVAELDGLFPGYRVVRTVTFAGSAMVLVPMVEGGVRR